jgi:hypothetical protein
MKWRLVRTRDVVGIYDDAVIIRVVIDSYTASTHRSIGTRDCEEIESGYYEYIIELFVVECLPDGISGRDEQEPMQDKCEDGNNEA